MTDPRERLPIRESPERLAAFQAALVRAQNHVRQYTAALVGYDEFQDPNGIIGSGIYVREGERLFILTAAHNVDNGKASPSEAFVLLSDRQSLRRAFRFKGGVIQGGKGDPDEKWDVAVVEVALAALAHVGRQALPPSRVDAAWKPTAESTVMMFGLTEDGIHERPDGTTHISEHSYTTMPLVGQPTDATLRPEIDLFLSYPKDMTAYRDLELVKPFSPRGLSGGGVWTMPDDNPDNMRLVALVVAAHPHRDWVKAIRIGHVIARLQAYLARDAF